jgi:hypothetical protein
MNVLMPNNLLRGKVKEILLKIGIFPGPYLKHPAKKFGPIFPTLLAFMSYAT